MTALLLHARRRRLTRGPWWALLAAYVFYLGCVGYLVFSPVATAPSTAIDKLMFWFRWMLGIEGVTPSDLEFVLNVVMFVPLTLLGTFLVPRLRAWAWLVVGFAATCSIEYVQLRFLPERTGSTRDLVSNTLGAAVGLVLATLVRVDLRAARRRRTASRGRSRPGLVLVALLGGLFLAGLAVVLLQPSGVRTADLLAHSGSYARRLGLPYAMTVGTVWEMTSNVLLLVPVGLLGAWLRPAWPTTVWLLIGTALAGAVELTQGLLLPDRNASLSDIVTNATGVALGALLVHLGWAAGLAWRRLTRPAQENVAPNRNPVGLG